MLEERCRQAGAPPPPPAGQETAPPQQGIDAQPAWPGAPPYAGPPHADQNPHAPQPQRPSLLNRWKSGGGALGILATVLILLVKFSGPLLFLLSKLKVLLIGLKALWIGKLFLTFGSMIVSMWFWGIAYGWKFGVGIVILIFIHECGHALAARKLGIPTGIMVFIPFMGAFVTTTREAKDVKEDAFIGIMGPVVGTLACLVSFALYFMTQSPFWLALAFFGFFMNLFNLAPTAPLDGGWIVPVFSPKLLAVGVVMLVAIAPKNPLIWILALLSIPRIIGGWKADPKTQPFYQVKTADKWKYGISYLGLAAFLGLMMYWSHTQLGALALQRGMNDAIMM